MMFPCVAIIHKFAPERGGRLMSLFFRHTIVFMVRGCAGFPRYLF